MISWNIEMRAQKSASWYMFAGIGAIALIMWGIFQEMYALSVVVVILCGVYIMIENNAPEHVTVRIDENGILAQEDFYDYAKVDSFGIIYEDTAPVMLRIRLKSGGLKTIDIPLSSDVSAAEIRAYLSEYANESERTEFSLSEKITRSLGI